MGRPGSNAIMMELVRIIRTMFRVNFDYPRVSWKQRRDKGEQWCGVDGLRTHDIAPTNGIVVWGQGYVGPSGGTWKGIGTASAVSTVPAFTPPSRDRRRANIAAFVWS